MPSFSKFKAIPSVSPSYILALQSCLCLLIIQDQAGQTQSATGIRWRSPGRRSPSARENMKMKTCTSTLSKFGAAKVAKSFSKRSEPTFPLLRWKKMNQGVAYHPMGTFLCRKSMDMADPSKSPGLNLPRQKTPSVQLFILAKTAPQKLEAVFYPHF
jgi:hypothetical protein